ncbi:flagellar L-ring protein FlgH [alpha proteobacterium U9-1i]|nr:flagellar L-ring protein FlgH [alpha proteobacterium U9-1i]
MSFDLHMRRIALIALAASAAGCASSDYGAMAHGLAQDAIAAPGVAYDAARRAAAPPQFAPVGSPAHLTGGEQQTMPQPAPAAYAERRPNSLWQAGSRSFFNDQRASRIGDILTVQIEISDKAELSNSSNRSRSASTSAGVSNFFGLEGGLGRIFGAEFDPENLIGAEAESDHNGQGAINREEKIELTVAAVIVDRLSNGNLVIAGRQEVRINAELRELTVSGIIRPEDIDANNTIDQTQIAEARIAYGGRGQISAVQRPNLGQRLGDAITPW